MKKKTCIDCNAHDVIDDPDPNDWFCDDDVAIVCRLAKDPKGIRKNSKYLADKTNFRKITVSCRPYNIRKEALVPEWCPKKRKRNEK